jgi:hypothetical protein
VRGVAPNGPLDGSLRPSEVFSARAAARDVGAATAKPTARRGRAVGHVRPAAAPLVASVRPRRDRDDVRGRGTSPRRAGCTPAPLRGATIEGDDAMAKADRKHHGPGTQGKGDGTGAMTDIDEAALPANGVLSNRDKSTHSEERGFDGRAVMTEQFQDHVGARLDDETLKAPDDADHDEDDLAAAALDEEGEGARVRLADIVEEGK